MKRTLIIIVLSLVLILGLTSTLFAADAPPQAKDDAYSFNFNTNQTKTELAGLFADNGSGADVLGTPAATLVSFGGGDLGGSVTSNAAGATVNLAGGSLTVAADGSWSLLGAPFEPGTFTFQYRLGNSKGNSNATVTFTIEAQPVAQDDALNVAVNQNNNLAAGTLFADNGNGVDDLGYPPATLTVFGGGDLGGAVGDNAAGATVAFAGGTLTVNANGSLVVDTPTVLGDHTFLYRIDNGVGQAEAGVTITVVDPPQAQDDAYTFMFNQNKNVSAGLGLFADNGSGVDLLGTPTAKLTTFGGGSLGGNAAGNPAGSVVDLAGGKLTVNANGSWSLTGAPFTPGQYTFDYVLASSAGESTATVTLNLTAEPLAKDDALVALIGLSTNLPAGKLFTDNGSGADDRGFPVATISSFGAGTLGGAVTDNLPGATVALAGGTLTVNANGSLSIANPTAAGTYTFLYRLENSVGQSDASVTVRVAEKPVAQPDTYTFTNNAAQNVGAGAGLFAANGSGPDALGDPTAVLSSFGGGALGGTVTQHLAGSAVSLAGGTLIVNADGSWSLGGTPFVPGNYTFSYRLTNAGGTSDAVVTFNIEGPPQARADQLGVPLNGTFNGAPGLLFANNGSGEDTLGFPAAAITSFGGGSLGGPVTLHAAGTAVPFAGGTLTVNAVGSVIIATPTIPGSFTFQYRLTNSKGTSDAMVTVLVSEPPEAKNDAITFQYDADQNVAAGAGLLTNNGSGADFLGTPTATLTSFGGGSLGDDVTAVAAGDSTVLAKGTLTVNADGSWSLTGAPFTPGLYTFAYRLTNAGGTSDAVVTLTIKATPQARDDDLATLVNEDKIFAPGTLFNDNGSGPDILGFPEATLTSFGGGTLGGTVTDHAAGASVPFAGGQLAVNTVGSFTLTNPTQLGTFTFLYRISSPDGFSDATVTLTVVEPPVQIDVYLPIIDMP